MSRLLREACLKSEIIKHRRKLKCLDEYVPLPKPMPPEVRRPIPIDPFVEDIVWECKAWSE